MSSAEILRRAAEKIRDDWGPVARAPFPFPNQSLAKFNLAVADWLDAAATNFGGWGGTGPLICHAVAVARAYLGGDDE